MIADATTGERKVEQRVTVLERIHAYWHAHARAHTREAIDISPVTLYLGPERDPRYTERAPGYNVVIPNDDAAGDVAAMLAQIRARVHERRGRAHVELIEELFPRLRAALVALGLREVVREPLLTCTAERLRPALDIPGLAIDELTSTSPLSAMQEALDVNERGFDPSYAASASLADAERFRRDLTAARAFTARLDGTPAAGGMYTAPFGGLSRIVGVATLEPYRRHGIAAALTTYITRAAFAAGVEVVFLAAASDDARRVYERIGYRAVGTIVGLDDWIIGD
jgi:GNAT superfamily N-acetyltransferase